MQSRPSFDRALLILIAHEPIDHDRVGLIPHRGWIKYPASPENQFLIFYERNCQKVCLGYFPYPPQYANLS